MIGALRSYPPPCFWAKRQLQHMSSSVSARSGDATYYLSVQCCRCLAHMDELAMAAATLVSMDLGMDLRETGLVKVPGARRGFLASLPARGST